MTDALMAWAEANQPIVVTPFLLAGATSAVSVSGGLAQQVAEALSGVALAQTVRAGVPCLYGSFFTVTDMRTGSPAFGTPESVFGVLAGGQLARRYGLPFRGGGGLASSPAVDAQAAAETQMMLWATMLAGTDVVLHAAGWLEGGLTRLLREVRARRRAAAAVQAADGRASGSREEELAFDALKEVGPGGLFLVVAAHAHALQGVALHEPAVPDARLRHVGDDGRGDHRGRGEPARGRRCWSPTRTPGSTRRSTRSFGLHRFATRRARPVRRRLSVMMGEQSAVVVSATPFNLHGVVYVDVTVAFEDRSTESARLGPESVPGDLEAGERVMVTRAANMVIGVRRG